MDFDCENMTVFGCPARDTAKNSAVKIVMKRADTGMDRQIGGNHER